MSVININGEILEMESIINAGGVHIAEGNIGANELVEEVEIEANNCTNITISSSSMGSESYQDSIKVDADHCSNITINTGNNVVYANNLGIIIGGITASLIVFILFTVFICLYLKRNRRTQAQDMLDTSQAPVASAMNLKFRDPPGCLSKFKRFFTKC